MVNLELHCTKHPTYRAIHPPRLPKEGPVCEACAELYRIVMGSPIFRARYDGTRVESSVIDAL